MVEFLAANWGWIVFAAVMFAMHRGGHGCGKHGRHHDDHQREPLDLADDDRNRTSSS